MYTLNCSFENKRRCQRILLDWKLCSSNQEVTAVPISSTHQTDLASPNNPAQQPGKKQSQSPQKKATTVLPFPQTPIPRSLAPRPPPPGRSGPVETTATRRFLSTWRWQVTRRNPPAYPPVVQSTANRRSRVGQPASRNRVLSP